METEKRRENHWQYILPCAFFDGEHKFLAEMQGWEQTITKDIVNKPGNSWARKTKGTSSPAEKWATEKVFYNETGNLLVMTFDILDQGISYMIWWLKGNTERKFGAAAKINGHWRVVLENEDLLKDMEAEEKSGICRIEKVCLKIYDKNTGETKAQTIISRD